MYKFFDLLFNFKGRKEDLIMKCFIWAVGLFFLCYSVASVI